MLTAENNLNSENQNNQVEKDIQPALQETVEVAVPEKMRPINIREVNKGYIIEIGCHTFAFNNVSDFLPQLTKYIKFPQKIEEAWFKGELFK